MLETRQRMNCEPFPVRKVVDECRSDREYFELIPISQNVHDPNDKKFPAILGRWFSDHNGSTFNVDDGKVKIVYTSTFDRKGGILWSLEWEQAA